MWIARDKDGTLNIFKDKPIKYKREWGNITTNVVYTTLYNPDWEDLFSEIKWEDDEPRELILK